MGLSSGDRHRLDHRSDVHQSTLPYRFKLGQAHRLTPEIILGYDDRDGDARGNTNYGAQLTYSYLGDPITLVLNGGISHADYDKKNPIYNKTQDNDTYGGEYGLRCHAGKKSCLPRPCSSFC